MNEYGKGMGYMMGVVCTWKILGLGGKGPYIVQRPTGAIHTTKWTRFHSQMLSLYSGWVTNAACHGHAQKM